MTDDDEWEVEGDRFRRHVNEVIARAYRIPDAELFGDGRPVRTTLTERAILDTPELRRANRSIALTEHRRHNWNQEELNMDRRDQEPLAADPDEREDIGWHLDGCPWLRPITLEGCFAESDVSLCTCFELDEDEETLIPS